MALIYLDEDVSVEIVPLLSGRAHDVVHAYDLNNRQLPDTDHLLYAANAGRVMVTHNRTDYEKLHLLWLALNSWHVMNRAHPGILTTWGQISANLWGNLLDDFLSQNENLQNQMWRWRRRQQEWESVGW